GIEIVPRASDRYAATLRAALIPVLARKDGPMPYALGIAAAALSIGLWAQPAEAQEKPTLTVYTYSGFPSEYGPGGTIKKRFEETCGCTLDWVESEDAG